jgi:formamidopyrimidine-DNA glycosylase
MPELPEVETVANGVHARIAGDRIDDVWFSGKSEPMKTPPAIMAEALTGRTIERVRRVGKHIVFDLGSEEPVRAPSDAKRGSTQAKHDSIDAKRGSVQAKRGSTQWIVHLGMTGRLLVSDADVPRPPHTHGVLILRSGRELRFVDPRRFGRMGLHITDAEPAPTATPRKTRNRPATPASSDTGFTGPGIDPLHISPADFRKLFRGRRTPIKAALLNQSLLHGVGNIYADESLFRAGIRPRRMAARLTAAEFDRLHTALDAVLREAIALGGSSVSDYVDADGARGFFQLQHRVYMRTGQPCLICGAPIRRVVLAGRGTHYCAACQR